MTVIYERRRLDWDRLRRSIHWSACQFVGWTCCVGAEPGTVNGTVTICPGKSVVVGVDQGDRHLVLAGRQPGDVDRIVVTRISPPPGQVVDDDVQMPDAWRYL